MKLIRREPEKPAHDGVPRIQRLVPAAALPGAEVRVEGEALKPAALQVPEVRFGGLAGSVLISSDRFVVARVPEGAISGAVQVAYPGAQNGFRSNELHIDVAVPIAENLHPVANPALDGEGNIVVTFSGSRGQKVPVSLFRVDTNYNVKPLSTGILNPTGLAFEKSGALYVSSRQDGSVYRVAPNGTVATYAEGMGIATGIAFDHEGNLYVGDRSGTIFKIDRERKTFVFATLEPSVAAYHLAFSPNQYLYVTGPTTSSFDTVWRINPNGTVEPFFRGLGRPQGLAFDVEQNLYVIGSLQGRRGIVRITPTAQAELVVSGHNLVGLAFARGPAMILATTSSLYHLDWRIAGLPLVPS